MSSKQATIVGHGPWPVSLLARAEEERLGFIEADFLVGRAFPSVSSARMRFASLRASANEMTECRPMVVRCRVAPWTRTKVFAPPGDTRTPNPATDLSQ